MKKFRIRYRAYDNDYWRHRDAEMIVEANNEDEAKEIVRNKSNYEEEYIPTSVEEIQ